MNRRTLLKTLAALPIAGLPMKDRDADPIFFEGPPRVIIGTQRGPKILIRNHTPETIAAIKKFHYVGLRAVTASTP